MFGILKKMFEKKPPAKERLPFYDIICPYCFAKFHHEDVVFRAAHYRDDDETLALQEDEKLNQYRAKFGLAPIDLEAVIEPAMIPDENKIYSDRVLMGVSDKYSVVTKTRLCPECHNELPVTAGKYPSNIVSIVGATSVGKSVYMTSLIHTLQHVTANNFHAACIPLDNEISRRFRQEYEVPLFENGSLLDSTARTRRQEPFIFQFVFKDEDQAPLTLVFFDVAGEGMTDKDYIQLHAAHIKNSSGILFLVDPMQIRSIREKLIHQLGENPGKIVGMADEPREVVISLFGDFIAHLDTNKTNIPTAVILTKSDLLNALKSEEGEYIRTNSNIFQHVTHQGYLNLDEFNNINGEVRRFLAKVDVPFVNALDVYFRDTSYFAVSALGSNPVDQQISGIISPIRVDEPFIWLLYKLGYIEGRHTH
ncbi:TRAFAC clade GTPase domain-containing protein [Neobacillus sp. LXY-1]|uniref:TRAFAC clade GTPase domain-containing protein n=1 Tax=Neobacillus sp. LXY-1 TaxID=3379133 RepID=UPI003EDF963C